MSDSIVDPRSMRSTCATAFSSVEKKSPAESSLVSSKNERSKIFLSGWKITTKQILIIIERKVEWISSLFNIGFFVQRWKVILPLASPIKEFLWIFLLLLS